MTVSPFNHHATDYCLEHAYWLAKAAQLAYKDESAIRAETKNWGFDQCSHFCGNHQMPFPIEDTQA